MSSIFTGAPPLLAFIPSPRHSVIHKVAKKGRIGGTTFHRLIRPIPMLDCYLVYRKNPSPTSEIFHLH
jgi:hypothetical protein